MSTIGEEEKSIITANNLFAVDLYRLLAREDQNLFISPFSVLTCLYMAYAGARKNTAAEMERVLHVAIQQDKFHEGFSHFSSLLGVSEGYEFAIANALSMKDKRQILESYKDIIKRAYDGEFLEFSIETINNWVTKKTHGHIKNIINPSDLSTTLLVLLNAVYFKGVWHFQFDEDVTRNSDFFLLSGKTVQVPMMCQTAEFRYDENSSMQILEMVYKGTSREISIVIFLPKERTGLPGFEDRITAELLQQSINNLQKREVEVFFPRFSIETQYELDNALQDMGIAEAFTPNADFSGMTDDPRGLMFEKILHKATIEVDEKGTVATAATATMMTLGAYEPSPVFKADHPFILFLRDMDTGTILFIGKILNPVGTFEKGNSSLPLIKRLAKRFWKS